MVYQQKLPSAAAYYDRRKMITKMPRFFYLLLGVNFFIAGKCLSHLVFSRCHCTLLFAAASQPPPYSLFSAAILRGRTGGAGKRGEREKEDWLLVFWAEEKKGEARSSNRRSWKSWRKMVTSVSSGERRGGGKGS